MKKTLPLAAAALALLAGTAALAQQDARPTGDITRADAEARAAAMFERLDANADGQLSAADREEHTRQRFDEADTDGNGQLSFAEVTAAQESRRDMREQRHAERAENAGRMGDGLRGRGGRMGERIMAHADSDNDGTVSKAEFTSAAMSRFERADTDGDGTISADERRQRGGERHGHRWQRG